MSRFNFEKDDLKFRYMLLDRLRLDARYVINRLENYQNESYQYILGKPRDNLWVLNHLWGGSDHFEAMQELINTFSKEEKPEWLSEEDIAYLKSRLEEMLGCSLKEIR